MGFKCILFCSTCGEEYKDRKHHHHECQQEDILKRALGDGWHGSGDFHLCPICKQKTLTNDQRGEIGIPGS